MAYEWELCSNNYKVFSHRVHRWTEAAETQRPKGHLKTQILLLYIRKTVLCTPRPLGLWAFQLAKRKTVLSVHLRILWENGIKSKANGFRNIITKYPTKILQKRLKTSDFSTVVSLLKSDSYTTAFQKVLNKASKGR